MAINDGNRAGLRNWIYGSSASRRIGMWNDSASGGLQTEPGYLPMLDEVTLSQVNNTVELQWDELQLASDTLTLQWNDLQLATDTLDARWNIATTVNDTVDLRWNINQLATDTLDLRWNLTTAIQKQLEMDWALASLAAKSYDIRWDITVPVQSQKELLWDIANKVANDVAVQWNLGQFQTGANSTTDLSLAPVTHDLSGASENTQRVVDAVTRLRTIQHSVDSRILQARNARRIVVVPTG